MRRPRAAGCQTSGAAEDAAPGSRARSAVRGRAPGARTTASTIATDPQHDQRRSERRRAGDDPREEQGCRAGGDPRPVGDRAGVEQPRQQQVGEHGSWAGPASSAARKVGASAHIAPPAKRSSERSVTRVAANQPPSAASGSASSQSMTSAREGSQRPERPEHGDDRGEGIGRPDRVQPERAQTVGGVAPTAGGTVRGAAAALRRRGRPTRAATGRPRSTRRARRARAMRRRR